MTRVEPTRRDDDSTLDRTISLSSLERRRIRDELRRLWQVDPLFAPHAEDSFTLLSELGEGGMARVVRVRDRRLDREAALKLMKESSSSALSKERFLREARVTARLNHPSIPPIFELGATTSGQQYMLMRVIEGQTLAQHLSESALDSNGISAQQRESLQILVKVAEAVAYAHEQGIIHRDLKPENIMLGDFGEVMVMDWGIALDLTGPQETVKQLDSSYENQPATGLTREGTYVGTPGYMSPEQASGQAVDRRSDVFALGAILFEILTGQAAIRAPTELELIVATASGAFPKPKEIVSGLPRDLSWIAEQAMEVDRTLRTQSARLFFEQLKGFLNGDPIPGYSYGLKERAEASIRRRPGRFLAILLVLITASLATTLLFQLRAAERSREQLQSVLDGLIIARDLARRRAPPEKIRSACETLLKKASRSRESLMETAEVYAEAGLYHEARDLLEEATPLYEAPYDTLFFLHRIELLSKNSPDAIKTKYIRKIEELAKSRNEENAYSLYSQAIEADEKGNPKRALELYNKVEAFTRGYPPMYVNRGAVHGQLDHDELALADFDRAILLAPVFYQSYANRAVIYKSRKEWTPALKDLDRAIELKADSATLYFYRAEVLAALQRPENALEDYDKGLSLEPQNASGRLGRAHLLILRGKAQDALTDLDLAIDSPDYRAQALRFRAKALQALGRSADCLADCNSLLDIQADDRQILELRASIFQALGQLPAAIKDLDAALALQPDDFNLLGRRGAIAFANRDFPLAINLFSKMLEGNEKQPRRASRSTPAPRHVLSQHRT